MGASGDVGGGNRLLEKSCGPRIIAGDVSESELQLEIARLIIILFPICFWGDIVVGVEARIRFCHSMFVAH